MLEQGMARPDPFLARLADFSPRAPRSARRISVLPRRIHLLGAGGAGVSGAARVLVGHGHVLTGHDRAESEHTKLLRSLGVEIEVSAQELARVPKDAELVVRSAAISLQSPALREAQERGVPVLKYSEALGRITPFGRTLAVAGTHGKTTTSWMLYHALRGLALAVPDASLPQPGAIVGGVCRKVGANAVIEDDGGWFAVEACEYDRSFLNLSPHGSIITNVEADHLDYFGDFEQIKSAFARFVERAPVNGLIVLGPDVPRSVEQAARAPVWRMKRDFDVALLRERSGYFTFGLKGPGFTVAPVSLSVPGNFNALNAGCALALAVGLVAREWKMDPNEAAYHAARGIEQYCGSQRRFESWGNHGGVEVVHDYAHHPTEVNVTLEAASRVFPGRKLHVLFQPHQHSRTAHFLAEFAAVLATADRAVVTDVYGARVHIDGEHFAGAAELAAAARGCGGDVEHIANLSESARRFAKQLPPRALALVLGAGDVENVKDELLRHLPVRVHATSAAR
jgi:UDP-N-acetylmuramate--alanine ligase